jgi:hypothetical protein
MLALAVPLSIESGCASARAGVNIEVLDSDHDGQLMLLVDDRR